LAVRVQHGSGSACTGDTAAGCRRVLGGGSTTSEIGENIAVAGAACARSAEDEDRIEGAAERAKGAVTEARGTVAGNAKLQAEGKADQAEGKLQNAVGGLKNAICKI